MCLPHPLVPDHLNPNSTWTTLTNKNVPRTQVRVRLLAPFNSTSAARIKPSGAFSRKFVWHRIELYNGSDTRFSGVVSGARSPIGSHNSLRLYATRPERTM